MLPQAGHGLNRPYRYSAMRWVGLTLLAVLMQDPALAAQTGRRLERIVNGIHLVALTPKPGKSFDTSLVPPREGLDRMAGALDRLITRSPASAQALETLKKSGEVLLAYVPDDLRSPTGDGEAVALYVPQHRRDPAHPGQERTFRVLVGRHGIKWPEKELAAVLAHELLGHGLQDYHGRFEATRILDLECEAYLREEIANQDLGLNKFSREMIKFRQALEQHWCAEFKTYMRANRPDDMALWDTLNPDIPKLLKDFRAYTTHLKKAGVSSRALAAARRQFREQVDRALDDPDAEDLFNAAVALRNGSINVKPDMAEAFRYFLAAARQGHTGAMLNTARMYEKGTGVAPDLTAALSWYRRAAARGNVPAQTYSGWLHLTGRGVAQDYNIAFRFLSLAAAQNNPQASYYLATMYRLGLGRSRDQRAAVRLYQAAAADGFAPAQYRLAWHLYRGIGIAEDRGTAAQWFTRAAKQGHAVSQNSLGWMYLNGVGVAKDPVRAAQWLRKAAEQGYTSAQEQLADLYRQGKGVQRDPVAAYVWYSLAAKAGHADAAESRDLLATELPPEDLADAQRRVVAMATERK